MCATHPPCRQAEGAIAAGEGDNLMPLPDQDQAATAALGDLVLGLDLPTFHATNGLCARLLGDGRVVSGAVDRKIKVARVLDEHGTPLAADAVEATTLPFVSSGCVPTHWPAAALLVQLAVPRHPGHHARGARRCVQLAPPPHARHPWRRTPGTPGSWPTACPSPRTQHPP